MLINCVAYKDGSKLGDVAIDDISDYLAQPGCFVWVALKDATPEELSKMQEEATSGRRSRSTTTPCSRCCTRWRSARPTTS